MLDLNFEDKPRRELAPARALLTPTWIAALALLVANDHWLKGSGLVPGVLTGKLSDFAGMIVAPVLLASLLGVRSRRALALCHVAVGVVFAGIQLSPAFAAQWSALMGLVGHPWAITCDPTDLIALPFLLVSWALLVPAMDPSRPALVPLQRTAVAALSVFGLWSTVATSDDSGIDPTGEWFFDVFGNVYVNNANDFEVSLFIRELRDDVDIDCNEVSLDPGRLLSDAAFGEAEHWLLPARTNVGIEFDSSANCGAALVAGEGIPPQIVFVNRTTYSPRWFPGQTFDPDDLELAGLGVVFGDNGGAWVGNDMIRFTPREDAPEQPEECEAPELESRIDWTDSVPSIPVELLDSNAGPDGCYELLIQRLEAGGGNFGSPLPFYLCAPTLPFAVGERLAMQEFSGVDGERRLILDLLNVDTLAPAVDDLGAPVRRVQYIRGANNAAALVSDIGRSVSSLSSASCPWLVEEGCATVERPTELAYDGGFFEVGVPVELGDESGVPTLRTVVLAYARERAVIDQQCADGANVFDSDIDLVVIEEPL